MCFGVNSICGTSSCKCRTIFCFSIFLKILVYFTGFVIILRSYYFILSFTLHWCKLLNFWGYFLKLISWRCKTNDNLHVCFNVVFKLSSLLLHHQKIYWINFSSWIVAVSQGEIEWYYVILEARIYYDDVGWKLYNFTHYTMMQPFARTILEQWTYLKDLV